MGNGSGDNVPAWVVVARGSREAVEAALRRQDLAPRVRERLEMVKVVALGHGLDDVARWSGRTERTVVRWLAAFAAGGNAARYSVGVIPYARRNDVVNEPTLVSPTLRQTSSTL